MVEKVYSIGGSIVRHNLDDLKDLANALDGEEQVLVVTGAGELSKYQDAISGSANNGEQDLVGIQATRLHARTLVPVMNANPSIPEKPEEILKAASDERNVVMGGLTPGYSTDATAAIAAELLDAELCIATTIDGVYTDHPDSKDAEKLHEVKPERLLDLVGDDLEPGSYELVDSTAVKIIGRSGIPTQIFEGTLENIADQENADGTRIVHE